MTDKADEPRMLWSEENLDEALAMLHVGVPTDDHVLARGRTKLLAAATARPDDAQVPAAIPDKRVPVMVGAGSARGRPARAAAKTAAGSATGTEVGTDAGGRSGRWRWAAAAAAVAGLVAGGLVVQAATMDGDSPGVSALAIDLDSVAGRVGASYQPLGPGQFRYVEVHAWWYRTVPSRPGLRYLAENRQETWIPANEIDTWLHRRDLTGRRKWITGSEAEARKVKYPPGSKISDPFWEPADQDGVWKARCGEFFGIGMLRPDGTCPGGSWSIPTQAWAARAPRDPAKILAQLRADSIKNNGRGDIEILNVAADSLRTGRLPADLQAALFRALALIPDLTITNKLANADGRVGAGYGIDDGRTRFDLILDPKTGEFIGEREVITRDGDIEGPRGTVIDHTAVAAKVVGALGAAR